MLWVIGDTMALSMTGCGSGVSTDGPNSCHIELRSVNNRFFKLSLRSREGYSPLEHQIESVIRKRVHRGSVHMSLDMTGPLAVGVRRLDTRQLSQYLNDLKSFCADCSIPEPRSVDGLLSLPGVYIDEDTSHDALPQAWPLISHALEDALDKLNAMRQTEGEALASDLRAICRTIRSLATTIQTRVPDAVSEHHTRIKERVEKILESRGNTIEPTDLARELAILADRSDVAEELVRLESHIDQATKLLDETTPGRKLDFLAQELSREANTIASKSSDVIIARAVIDMKAQIERFREQVQNIE